MVFVVLDVSIGDCHLISIDDKEDSSDTEDWVSEIRKRITTQNGIKLPPLIKVFLFGFLKSFDIVISFQENHIYCNYIISNSLSIFLHTCTIYLLDE